MPHLLLTNDDGVDSPALVPFAGALEEIGEVTTVVPDGERSWIGKAITRSGEVATDTVERGGRRITTCTGYPADATQLGVHHICEPSPDIVVSGINLGLNHGAAFTLSSGTVGAAVEGWICGLPAIAFSTGPSRTDRHRYQAWRQHTWSRAARDEWSGLAATCTAILTDLMRSGVLDVADVVSVNLPFDATPATPRRLTQLARVRYGSAFRSIGSGRYRSAFVRIDEPQSRGGTDVEALHDNVVSITPLRMPVAADISDALRTGIERTTTHTT